MAQPYTARQLSFFKTTLKILESAIFETVLSASETETLQNIPVTLTAELTVETTVDKDVDETNEVKSSYFSVSLEPIEALTTAVTNESVKQTELSTPLLVAAQTGTKTSAVFFHALPWHQASDAITNRALTNNTLNPVIDDESIRTVTASSVIAVPDAKKCADFFGLLPWKSGTPSISVKKAQTVTSNTLNVGSVSDSTVVTFEKTRADISGVSDADTLPMVKSCAAFFRALPWNGDYVPSAASIINSGNIVVSTTIAFDEQTTNMATVLPTAFDQNIKNTSAGFFHALPWQGQKKSIGDTDIISAMNSDDFQTIANLATQTALHTAQRGSIEHDVIPSQFAGQKTASRFFQTLPW